VSFPKKNPRKCAEERYRPHFDGRQGKGVVAFCEPLNEDNLQRIGHRSEESQEVSHKKWCLFSVPTGQKEKPKKGEGNAYRKRLLWPCPEHHKGENRHDERAEPGDECRTRRGDVKESQGLEKVPQKERSPKERPRKEHPEGPRSGKDKKHPKSHKEPPQKYGQGRRACKEVLHGHKRSSPDDGYPKEGEIGKESFPLNHGGIVAQGRLKILGEVTIKRSKEHAERRESSVSQGKARFALGVRGKLLAFFLLVSLVPLAVLTWLSTTRFQGTLMEWEFENAEVITERVARELASTLSRNIEYALFLAEDRTLTSPEVSPEEKSRVLAAFVKDHPLTLSASLTDASGIQIADSGGVVGEDKSDLEWFQVPKATGKPYLSDVRLSRDLGVYVMNVACPVYDSGGTFAGVVTLRLDTAKISEEITQGVRLAQTGYPYVYCAKHKDIVAHPDKSLIGKTLEELGLGFLNEPLQRERGTVRYTFRGVEQFGVFAKVEPYRYFSGDNWKDWRVVGVFPVQEILAPVRAQMRFALLLLAVVGVAVAFFSFFLSGSFVAPVKRMVAYLERLAQGDLTASVEEAHLRRRDEFGVMARAFAEMVKRWRSVVGTVVNHATTLAASSEELTSSVSEVSRATQEIAKTIAQVADGANRQGEELQKLNERVHEVSDEAKNIEELSKKNLNLLEVTLRERITKNAEALAEVTKNIEEAVREGGSVADEAEKGRGALNLLVENIERIARISQEVGQSIAKLEGRSQEIGRIVDVITGIAEQTNLLALNAAIEAARAGEAGRGFAVVAEEVRKLAESSAQAAQQIAQLIAEIQKDTQDAVHRMDRTSAEVKEGVSQAQNVVRGLQNIIDAIGKVREAIGRISASRDVLEGTRKDMEGVQHEAIRFSGDIARAVASITENIATIAEQVAALAAIAEENAASSEEVSASTEEQSASLEEITSAVETLSKIAQELQETVAVFQV
jgi:methyl-accepting chemotaxis protein